MKVTATRGVCIGPLDNMTAGETRFLDRQTAIQLLNLGAVVEAAGDTEVIEGDSISECSDVTVIDDGG